MSSSLNVRLRGLTAAPQKPDKLKQLLLTQGIQVLTEQESLQSSNPWDIICSNEHQRRHILHQFKTFKTLGLGNTYIEELWHCERIDLLFERLFALNPTDRRNSILFELPNSLYLVLEQWLYQVFNVSLMRQYDVAKIHYDLPTELYEGFLGESMKYTTGDWTGLEQTPENLTAAQEQNLAHWVKELDIHDGDIVLDCGSGWGTLPAYLRQRMNVTYVGITISQVQVDYCRTRFQDTEGYYFYNHSYHDGYREILAESGVDHITKCIFLETLEHGGTRNWPRILKHVREAISSDGLLGLQVIGADHPTLVSDPYINRYIFPHASLGSPSELGRAIECDRQFIICQERNIAHHYPATLNAWHHLFQQNWSTIRPHIEHILDSTPFQTVEAWKRHWEFYLLFCAGALRAGTYPQVYQLTVKPNFYP